MVSTMPRASNRWKSMNNTSIISSHRRAASLVLAVVILGLAVSAGAHPLGNFTINHSARIEPGADRVRLHYVIDMAEIPAFQVLQKINPNGVASSDELASYARELAPQLAANLLLVIDDQLLGLSVIESRVMTVAGAGGLPTLRIEIDF